METRWWIFLPDDATGSWRDLEEDLGIPYPRTQQLSPRAIRATVGWRRIADGYPILVWEWGFDRPEWLRTLFGGDWVEGKVLFVDRWVRGRNIPLDRGEITIPTRTMRVRFRRPALHRDVRWDMGVWTDVRVEGIILQEGGGPP